MLHREPGTRSRPHAGHGGRAQHRVYVHELAAGEAHAVPTDDMLSRPGRGRAHRRRGRRVRRCCSPAPAARRSPSSSATAWCCSTGNPEQWREGARRPRPARARRSRRSCATGRRRSTRAGAAPPTTEWHGVTIPANEPVLLHHRRREPRRARVPGPGPLRHRPPAEALRRLRPRDPHLPRRRARPPGVAIAFEEIADRWPEYAVDERGCAGSSMSNVAGYSNVPVTVPACLTPQRRDLLRLDR